MPPPGSAPATSSARRTVRGLIPGVTPPLHGASGSPRYAADHPDQQIIQMCCRCTVLRHVRDTQQIIKMCRCLVELCNTPTDQRAAVRDIVFVCLCACVLAEHVKNAQDIGARGALSVAATPAMPPEFPRIPQTPALKPHQHCVLAQHLRM